MWSNAAESVTLVRPLAPRPRPLGGIRCTGPLIPSAEGSLPLSNEITKAVTLTMLEHDEARGVAHQPGLQPERAEVLAQQPGEKRRAGCSSDISLASGSVIRDGKE
eukprot:scaffold137777_cov69-Phaeocystis_antarctica.AAC.2